MQDDMQVTVYLGDVNQIATIAWYLDRRRRWQNILYRIGGRWLTEDEYARRKKTIDNELRYLNDTICDYLEMEIHRKDSNEQVRTPQQTARGVQEQRAR